MCPTDRSHTRKRSTRGACREYVPDTAAVIGRGDNKKHLNIVVSGFCIDSSIDSSNIPGTNTAVIRRSDRDLPQLHRTDQSAGHNWYAQITYIQQIITQKRVEIKQIVPHRKSNVLANPAHTHDSTSKRV